MWMGRRGVSTGSAPGAAGRVVVDARDASTDVFPTNPDATVPRSEGNADALWSISLDSLIGGDGAGLDTSTPLLAVFVDAVGGRCGEW